MQLTTNFNSTEFDCKCCGKGGVNMNPVLLSKLQDARSEYARPMQITSGYRCDAHNASVGGVRHSPHITYQAADISCQSGSERFRMLRILLRHFDRVGVAKTFIHVDVDVTKPQGVVFLY